MNGMSAGEAALFGFLKVNNVQILVLALLIVAGGAAREGAKRIHAWREAKAERAIAQRLNEKEARASH